MDGDRYNLDQALRVVREAVPGATAIDVQSSDQNPYGFMLTGIHVDDVVWKGDDGDDDRWDSICDLAGEYLMDLDWNGVVGDDKRGYATVPIPPEPTGTPFEVEVQRTVYTTVTVHAEDADAALALVQRADFPLPALSQWSGLEGWTFVVRDKDGIEELARDEG